MGGDARWIESAPRLDDDIRSEGMTRGKRGPLHALAMMSGGILAWSRGDAPFADDEKAMNGGGHRP